MVPIAGGGLLPWLYWGKDGGRVCPERGRSPPSASGTRSRGTTQPGGKGWRRSHRCISSGHRDTAQGIKTGWLGGPPSTPHACTHCHGRGAGPAPSPQPHGRRRGGGRAEGTRFWSFNTCRIKFVSVQLAVGKGPSVLRGKFLPAKSRSNLVTSLAAGDLRPQRWAHRSGLVASRGHVHPIAGLGGSQVPSWGCADAGTGQGWPARIHGVSPRSLLRAGRFPRCPASASPGTARGQGSPQGPPARRPASQRDC